MRCIWVLPVLLLAAFCQAQLRVREVYDVVYTNGGGIPQRLDYYQPMGLANMPAIVFVHGGGWSGGSKTDFASWGRYYAARGYFCASINYRLTQQASWPAQIDDCQSAVRWVRKNAQVLGVNATRVSAVGASAGGHLSLMLGFTDTLNDLEPELSGYSSKVKVVGDYFGPTVMTSPFGWQPNIWQLIVALAGQPWWAGNPAYRAISPYFYASADDAATIIFHGTADAIVPVRQSQKMFELLLGLGVPVQYMEFAGAGHGFSGNDSTNSINALTAFLAARL